MPLKKSSKWFIVYKDKEPVAVALASTKVNAVKKIQIFFGAEVGKWKALVKNNTKERQKDWDAVMNDRCLMDAKEYRNRTLFIRKNVLKHEEMTPMENKKFKVKKKAVVFFHKSDFLTLDEYIAAMRRPSISDMELAKADWDGKFMDRLKSWKGIVE